MTARLLFALCLLMVVGCSQSHDPLPSWNAGEAKDAILGFVKETTREGDEHFIPQEERIVTFDQDGTLWVEHPIYTQFIYALDTVKTEAANHPDWKTQEPFKSVLEGDYEKIKDFTLKEIEEIMAVSHAGMTVDEFNKKVDTWLQTAVHPRFKRPFTKLIYQPMLEVIQYFKANGYKVYIASGGGQEFIRTFAEKVYGIPPEQVIGSTTKVKYEIIEGQPALVKLPEVLFIDDKGGKPQSINLMIGRRPVASLGNSDGDQQMLEWSQGGSRPSLQLLVHHDDAVREYAYDVDTKVGTFSKSLMDEAKQKGWIVISMKNDWKVIFPTEEIK